MQVNRFKLIFIFSVVVMLFSLTTPTLAQDNSFAPATIVDDEGGPRVVRGEVTYTNLFFTSGVAQPLVILEDQAGFVDRNESFVFPPESQVLGQITSDFFTSPFTYSIALPIEPQGSLRDVDNDGDEDTGVMVFAVAYWNNTFGDPFLEERDLFGGGWSTAYASTRVSEDASTNREIVGGKYLVFAPDDAQGFPSDFGDDGLLFTGDEPVVGIPQGYTVVDLDTRPFTFSRPAEALIDLIEPEGIALDDFSDLSFTEAFDAMIDKMRREYAFTEFKGIDWDAKIAEFRPRFEEAEANNDPTAYLIALRDFTWSIPDGHVSGPFRSIIDQFQFETGGGLGMAIRELDDGRVIVNFLTPGGPAEHIGIELGAEIVALNNQPIGELISNTVPWSSPFSTEHTRRLQQLRYVLRSPVGTEYLVTYINPGRFTPVTANTASVAESESFSFSSFNRGRSIDELPVEFEMLDDVPFGYVRILSFSDNDLLTVQLWERMIDTLNQNGIPGLIIDMRQNGGGSGFLADAMAAYFFDEELVLGNTGRYNEETGDFFFDPRDEQKFILPSPERRYFGEVAVLVGPNCASACEFFSYAMTLQDRAQIVGHYPTAGLGGSVDDFIMPLGERIRFTIGRAVDADGNIHIEGKGVVPTVRVPVTEETLFAEGDPVLDAAIDALIAQFQ